MTRHVPEQVFSYLVLGLAKYTEQKQKYPYPPELLYTQHYLSLAMLDSYPASITGLFDLCKRPLETWWPGDVPVDIDKRFELLTPEGELSEWIVEYLTEYNLPAEPTLRDIQVILDNQLMIKVLNMARQAESYDPVGANRDYVAIRQYVITTPWTSREGLRKHFQDLRHIKIEDVGNLYQNSSSAGSALLYKRSDMSEECYWNCSACGPLYQRNGRLGSIKPGACEKRCPGMQGWQLLDVWDNTLVLRRGIHLRTHIPGIAEIELYRWLMDEVLPVHPFLQQVVLWPGVDRYDLQLAFQKEVWAVDVKDYKDPFALGKYISNDQHGHHQNFPSDLEWQQWFYVYPMYREWQRPDYQACVLRAAGQLPSNVAILSEEQFKARVLTR